MLLLEQYYDVFCEVTVLVIIFCFVASILVGKKFLKYIFQPFNSFEIFLNVPCQPL